MSRHAIVLTGATGALVIVAAYLLSSQQIGNLQMVTAALVLLICLMTTLLRPTLGIMVVSAILPFLGVLRRILYEQSPVSFDALLLVIPLYSGLLLLAISVTHRKELQIALHESLTTRLLLLLMGIFALQVFNPLQGRLAVGVAGALFYLVPLFWFFIGRILLTEYAVRVVITIFLSASVMDAGYGLMQTFVGFPSFDAYWIAHAGYTALNVGGTIRAIGLATSSAEYAAFLAAGLTCMLALVVFRRQLLALVPAALLGVALVLDASRTIVVVTVVIAVVLLTLRQRSKRVSVIIITLVCVVGAFAYQLFSNSVYTVAPGSSSPVAGIIAHQVNGLAHPLDQKYSTGQLHIQAIVNAFQAVLHSPFGIGLGATTLSATKFGATSMSAEVDIPNMFLSAGIIAGILYVAILYRTFRAAVALVFRCKRIVDVLAFAAVAVTFGQILNGGYYSLMPFIWMFIAWIDYRGTHVLVPQHTTGSHRQALREPLQTASFAPNR